MHCFNKIPWLLMAFSLLALSGCGGGAAGAPTVDTAPIYTQLASTAVALQTQTAQAMPTATDTPLVSPTPEASNTPLFTDTLLPGTPSVTALASNTPKVPLQPSCDNMEYVSDVNYQDGYAATPGEVMDKTWRVMNPGPCTWNLDYRLVFGWGGVGTDWQNARVNVYKIVPPGDSIELTLSLRAPKDHGEYGAVFVMQNDKGINFPPGQVVSIYIKVQ
jgi:Ig-like domain from next to BRCA1 gene